MIKVTERAGCELKRLLDSHTDNWCACLRLMGRSQNKLGLGIDIEMPGDQVIEHEGVRVLLVEQELSRRLDGIAIDAEVTTEGVRLVVLED
ncbi:MAG: hypothetical protein ABID87_00935 [Chloroflexota bacterium]